MKHYWLSFADGDLPEGSQFLGVAIVAAEDFIDAVKRAHALGINPGGQVVGLPVPDDKVELVFPHTERLLSKEDIVKAGLL